MGRNKQKVISIIASFFLLLQSWIPFLSYVIPAYSQTTPEEVKSEIEFDNDNNEFKVSVNTKEEVEYILSYQTDEQTEAISGKAEKSDDKDFERKFYAGTCSTDGNCLPDVVLRGVLKTKIYSIDFLNVKRFTIDAGQLNLVLDENTDSLEISDVEKKWLEDGVDLSPPQTPTPTVTEESTSSQEGEILDGLFTSVTPTITPIPENTNESNEEPTLAINVLENVDSSALLFSEDLLISDLSAALSTDKEDYFPDDQVIITGSNLLTNTIYTLVVSSQDYPPTTFEDQVETDENGSFIYIHQLDGIERLNYKAELKDESGEIVAVVTFTDTDVTVVVTKTPNDGTVNQGDPAIYTITINPGGVVNTTAGNVILTDQLPAGLWTVTIISPDGDDTCSIDINNILTCNFGNMLQSDPTKTITVSRDTVGICGVVLDNDVSITYRKIRADGSDHGQGSDSDNNNKITIENCIDVSVEKTADDSTVSAGNIVHYNIKVTNESNQASGAFTLTDTLPSGTSGLLWEEDGASGFPTGTNCSIVGNVLTCTINSLTTSGSGSTKTIQVKADTSLSDCGVLNNTATISVPNDGNAANDSDSQSITLSCKDIKVTKTGNGPINVGETAQFTIVASEVGGEDISNVVLSDILPSGTWTVNGPGSGGSSCDQTAIGSFTCPNFTLNNDTSKTYTVTRITTEDDCPSLTNQVSVSAATEEGPTDNNSANATININGCAPTTGTVTIHKDVVNVDGIDISDSHQFTVKKDGADGQTIAEGTDAVYDPLTPDTYTFTEDADDDYTLDSITGDDDSDPSNGANVTVVAGQNTELTFVNKQIELTICHSAGGSGNYVEQSESPSGVYNGHLGIGHQDGNDIIPIFTYQGNSYSQNWDAEGQAIWDNGCVVPAGSVTVNKQVDTDGDGIFDGDNSEANTLGFEWSLDSGTNNAMGATVALVSTGSHDVTETSPIPIGYHFVGWFNSLDDSSCENPEETKLPASINVNNTETTEITLCNAVDSGTITVIKDVIDPDGNPVEDNHDFTISLDDDVNVDPLNETNSIVYNNVLGGGQHTISESDDPDYDELGCTLESGDPATDFTVYNEDDITVTCTNQQEKGTIIVTKEVVDENNNDVLDTSTDFTFNVGTESAELTDEESQNFAVNPGEYFVEEIPDLNYEFLGCEAEYDGNEVGDQVENGVNVTLESGDTVTVSCTNRQNFGDVIVTKYQDDNGNGIWDDGESVLPDWVIHLSQGEDFSGNETTDALGIATFSNLLSGSYILSEPEVEGWTLTNIICSIDQEGAIDISNEHSVSVNPGDEINCEIGNQPPDPVLSIEKSNDSVSDELPGNSVLFTLTVTATQSAVLNAQVIDLPAGGFQYVPGSWTATSNINGVLSIPEPIYASPGTWQLGNMEDGETITLTYSASIASTQKQGLYKDLAWAKGDSLASNEVLANDTTGVFVGTDVNVINNENTALDTSIKAVKNETKTGDVLGASTLPATGIDSKWVQLASILLSIGLFSVLFGLLVRKKLEIFNMKFIKKYLAGLFGVLLLFVFVSTVHAASLSIRLSEPKTPTNTSPLNMNFVVLQTDGDPVTVECFKKGPSDAVFTQFGSTLNLIAGGNSGNCVADDSILTSDGTYKFYATADDTINNETSETLTIEYSTSGPSTPTNYSKNKIESCKYEIKFKTANDGKTVEVRLYRSQNTSFGIDDSNKVHTLAIGPNTDGTIQNTISECDKTHYYAVRAFDIYGNGSGVVGDSEVTFTTVTTGGTTTTAGAVGAGAGETLGAIEVAGETLGEETVTETGVEGQAETGPEQEQVLGAKSDSGLLGFLNTTAGRISLGVLILIIIVIYAKKFLKKGPKKA